MMLNEAYKMSYWFGETNFYPGLRELKCNLEWITTNTVILVYKKFPLLLVNFMDVFTLSDLWKESNEVRRIQIFGIIANIFAESLQKEVYLRLLKHMEETLIEILEKYSYERVGKQQNEFLLMFDFILSLEIEVKLEVVTCFLKYSLVNFQEMNFNLLRNII